MTADLEKTKPLSRSVRTTYEPLTAERIEQIHCLQELVVRFHDGFLLLPCLRPWRIS